MLPTTIRSPPSPEDYIPLEQYQSQTPESFIDSKPVLHFHLVGAKATIPKSQRGSLALFPADATSVGGSETNGEHEHLIEQTVDVLANSDNLVVFSSAAATGVLIPYPTISIHAVKQVPTQAGDATTPAVWMQLEFSEGGDEDDDYNCIELTIIPSSSSEGTPSPASQLYEAVATCSNLHPDPRGEDEDDEDEEPYDRIVFEGSAEHEALDGYSGVMRGNTDGGLPPPLPGSGGWITADNMHEYFDADGNWIGEGAEELGDGAGRIRTRDEVESVEGEQSVNGQEDPKRHKADES